MTDRTQVFVQLVHQRLAGRNIQVNDVLVRDAVQVLDQRAQAVAVSRHQNATAGADCRSNRLVPERNHAGYGVLQALSARQLISWHTSVASIKTRSAWIVFSDVLGSDCVGTTPDQDLILTVLLCGFGFI